MKFFFQKLNTTFKVRFLNFVAKNFQKDIKIFGNNGVMKNCFFKYILNKKL